MFNSLGKNYVMQFKDGKFLQQGEFHGFVNTKNGFEVGRTNDLKKAWIFTFDWEATRIANELSIEELYEIKEIEIQIVLI